MATEQRALRLNALAPLPVDGTLRRIRIDSSLVDTGERSTLTMTYARPLIVVAVVLACHGALLAAALWAPLPQPPQTEMPSISGILIQAPAPDTLQAAPPVPEAITPPPVATPPKPVMPPKPVVKPKPEAKPQPKPVVKPKPAPEKMPLPTPAVVAPAAVAPTPVPPAMLPPSPTSTPQPAVQQAAPAPVTPPRIDAAQRHNPSPVYPPASRRRGEEGTVLLALLVKKDGSVAEVSIKQSSGFIRLDRAALEAVKRWRYTPAEQGGQAIDYPYLQPITFGLRAR